MKLPGVKTPSTSLEDWVGQTVTNFGGVGKSREFWTELQKPSPSVNLGFLTPLFQKMAPGALNMLDSPKYKSLEPQPTAVDIRQVESNAFGRKKTRQRGRSSTILGGSMLSRSVLNFGKQAVGQ